MNSYDIEIPVLIVGGGPVGLVLALELEYHGINGLLIERNPTTTSHPKMDVTNGRSMELFRRLGYADEIRSHGVPSDHPLSVVWATKAAEWELARFDYPTVEQARQQIQDKNDGTMPLEPNMRVSQVVLEPALKNILERDAKHLSLHFGWGLQSFEQDETGVTAVIKNSANNETKTVRATYMVGCDGGSSKTRQLLDIKLDELSPKEILNQAGGVVKNIIKLGTNLLRGEKPADGRVYIIHFTSPEKDFFQRFGTAWHIQSPRHGTIISQNDKDTWTIHVPLSLGDKVDDIDPKQFLFAALGKQIECEILVNNAWRPRLALADQYAKGRVFLAGDSAHQVIPTGGYGMNTGVGDAVDIGWKLAAVINGWGGKNLLQSYQQERWPIGHRNRQASARHTAIRVNIAQAYSSVVAEDTKRGAAAREKCGSYIRQLGNLENEAWGIEFDYRYTESPIICHEQGQAPADDWQNFQPGSWPGRRPSSVFLEDGSALFDLLGSGFTLLKFGDFNTDSIEAAAKNCAMPLSIVTVKDNLAKHILGKNLVLIRPDQHVAWRGDQLPNNVIDLLDKVRGA